MGSWLVPRALRADLHRIYAFARVGDDLADELRDAGELARYRADLERHLDGATDVPLLADLTATLRARSLPPQLLFDLLDAFASDLTVHRHDRASLFAYCRKSADPVGRLVLRVFGVVDPVCDAASDRICTGLQILNHVQDVREDLCERDRIYLPAEDLARFRVTEADLRAPAASEHVRALVACWTDEAAALLREGFPLTARLRGRLRLEIRAIVAGAAAVVRAIRAASHDVLRAPVRLSRPRKLAAVLTGVLSGALPRSLR